MNIALYARVSSQRQAQDGTIEQQLRRLEEHAHKHGWVVPSERVYRDDGFSGANLARPGLDRLRDEVRAGKVDRVLITAPDRLARNYVHQVLLLEELGHNGCEVEFLDRPMSQDPNDQLLLQIRGAVAEYERTLIAERLRRGRQAKYRAGLMLPWTRVPYGYTVNPDRPRDPTGVRIDEAEAALIREIFEYYAAEGHTLFSLTKRLSTLGVPTPRGNRRWCKASVRTILTNPTYKGEVYAGRTFTSPTRTRRCAMQPVGRASKAQRRSPRENWILVATIPAIVSSELFERVQGKMAANQRSARRNNTVHEYLLRALVSCGTCGLASVARTATGGYRYYQCRGSANLVETQRDELCPARAIRADELDGVVWQDLCEAVLHPEQVTDALQRAGRGEWLPQELQARRENLRRARVSVGNQLERLTEAYLSGVVPLAEYQRRRADLEQRGAALDSQDRQLQAQAQQHAELAGMVKSVEWFCQRVQQGLDQATFEQRRQLVELLIDRVVVIEPQLEIRYVIPTSQAGEYTRFCHLRSDYCREQPDRGDRPERACELAGGGRRVNRQRVPDDAWRRARLLRGERPLHSADGWRLDTRRRAGPVWGSADRLGLGRKLAAAERRYASRTHRAGTCVG